MVYKPVTQDVGYNSGAFFELPDGHWLSDPAPLIIEPPGLSWVELMEKVEKNHAKIARTRP